VGREATTLGVIALAALAALVLLTLAVSLYLLKVARANGRSTSRQLRKLWRGQKKLRTKTARVLTTCGGMHLSLERFQRRRTVPEAPVGGAPLDHQDPAD
jgi:hypothetical protein